MHRIFVYGTLKRGFPNYAAFLNDACYRGDYVTAIAYPLVICRPWFVPSLLPEPGFGYRVSGELFEVDDATLALLDELEGLSQPLGYHRDIIEIEPLHAGRPVFASVYFRHRERAGAIADGPLASYDLDPRYRVSEDREWPDASLPPSSTTGSTKGSTKA